MIRRALHALLVAVALSLTAAGCASIDPDRESDMPWNMPQSWEGSPAIPGLSQ
jgi:hypothetical protein